MGAENVARVVRLIWVIFALSGCAVVLPSPRVPPSNASEYEAIWRQIKSYRSQARKSAPDTTRVASLIRAEHGQWISALVEGSQANLAYAKESQVSDITYYKRADFVAARELSRIPWDAAIAQDPSIGLAATIPARYATPDVENLLKFSRQLESIASETIKIEHARIQNYRHQQHQLAAQAKADEAARLQRALSDLLANADGRTRKESEAYCRSLHESPSDSSQPSDRDMCIAMIDEVEEAAQSVSKVAAVALGKGVSLDFLGELGRSLDGPTRTMVASYALTAGDQAAVIDSFSKIGPCTLNSHGTHECQYALTLRYLRNPATKFYGMTNPVNRPGLAGYRKAASGVWKRAPTGAEMAALKRMLESLRSSSSLRYSSETDYWNDWTARRAKQSTCTTNRILFGGSDYLQAAAYCTSMY